jgi:hypothetical protein
MAEAFQESFRPTALMVAQYLKNGLAKEFLPRLRAALYRNSTRESALVDAIVELCRPRRSRRALHSIVTFNFDDRIERALSAANVHFRSVFREGQRCGSDELPVYHVHGFLPEEGELSIDNEVVFSEDAYHSRFTEPFSWSNLIQLNHLNQNRCLFIGLSLTDPNLRRLLDAAMRKNPDRIRYHYVVKKRYTFSDVLQTTSASEREPIAPADLITIAEALEEQDANNLGLTVIWVDEYSEIPSFLERLAEVN